MTIIRSVLRLASSALPEGIQHFVLAKLSRPLRAQFCDKITDEFLELLLHGMDLAFLLCSGYRRNICGFRGTCVLRTMDDRVTATAVFERGHMRVEHQARSQYDLRVSFKDSHALWSFLVSENEDILDSILQNTVDTDGNLNYLFRFGFLANDLKRRLGVP